MAQIDPGMVKRIVQAVEEAGGRSAVLAKTSISSSSLDRYLRGETEMSASRLAEFSAATGRTIDWIVFGHDDASGVGQGASSPETRSPGGLDRDFSAGTVYIPLSNAVASAGAGIANSEDEEARRLPFSLALLRRHGVAFSNAQFVTARGDSMEPTIADGAVVLIDVSRRELVGTGIFVLLVDDALLIKRVSPGLASIRLMSDNKAYPDEVIARGDLDRVNVVGKVFWVGGSL